MPQFFFYISTGTFCHQPSLFARVRVSVVSLNSVVCLIFLLSQGNFLWAAAFKFSFFFLVVFILSIESSRKTISALCSHALDMELIVHME